MRIIADNRQKSATELADAILTEVGKFQAGADRFDDDTVVVLKVREP